MEIKAALQMMSKKISELERSTFLFETIDKPRYDADVNILNDLREKHLKLMSLLEKEERGEEITRDEIYDAVPARLR
jgi:hypothetical protein